MNVLLTSAGRRSYLVKYFKEALNGKGRVLVTNMYADAPAMQVADEAILVPPAHDKQYIPMILEICRRYEVGFLCPLHDLDVYILSQHMERFRQAGVVPVFPDAEWGGICLDKYECGRRLKKDGFDVPWTEVSMERALEALSKGEIHFPLLVKARMGYGSSGLNWCHDREELRLMYRLSQNHINRMTLEQHFHQHEEGVLIQEGLQGTEYCVDVVNDLAGEYVCHFALQVHTMRSGETDLVTTVDPAIAGDIPRRLSRLSKHAGIWGVDLIRHDGRNTIIDINPRFTGDYPFHQIAGANIPAALIAWARGGTPDPSWFKAEVGVKAFKDLVPTRLQPFLSPSKKSIVLAQC